MPGVDPSDPGRITGGYNTEAPMIIRAGAQSYINFNHNYEDYKFNAIVQNDRSGAAQVNFHNGTTVIQQAMQAEKINLYGGKAVFNIDIPTANINFQGGELSINRYCHADLSVSTGKISGRGTIGGLSSSSVTGIGSSAMDVGTLTIARNLNLAKSHKLEIKIKRVGKKKIQADRLVVNGNASLAGKVYVNLTGLRKTYKKNKIYKYTIMKIQGKINRTKKKKLITFQKKLLQNLKNFKLALKYSKNRKKVHLTVQRTK